MGGARQRAEALVQTARQSGAYWQYFVGLEGWIDIVCEDASTDEALTHSGLQQNGHRRVFLEICAYVTDGSKGHYGRSMSIELPKSLAHEVLENGMELSAAIDRFAGAVGIRDAQGAWGIFTRNIFTRQDAGRPPVVNAFRPFFNVALYEKS